jgi:hypothetical protein
MASVVSLLKPAADAGGRTSTYITLANAQKAYIVCYVTQGNAATVALTPLQAQDASGTNSKGLTQNAPIAVNLDCDTVPSDVLTIAAAATSYTTDAGTKTKMVIFEIDPIESMDINSTTLNASGVPQGFNHLAIQTGASNAANITSAIAVLMPLRYQQLNPPTANV